MSELLKIANFLEVKYAGESILKTPTQIKNWQSFLSNSGIQGTAGIAVDGILGPQTAGATSAFQLAHGIPQTGSVDAGTFAKSSVKAPSQMDADELMAWQVKRDQSNSGDSGYSDAINYKLNVQLPQLEQAGRSREEALVELGLDPNMHMGYRKVQPKIHQSVAPQMATRQQDGEVRVADRPEVDTSVHSATASAPIAKLLAFAKHYSS